VKTKSSRTGTLADEVIGKGFLCEQQPEQKDKTTMPKIDTTPNRADLRAHYESALLDLTKDFLPDYAQQALYRIGIPEACVDSPEAFGAVRKFLVSLHIALADLGGLDEDLTMSGVPR
jgi:hypothetical protein